MRVGLIVAAALLGSCATVDMKPVDAEQCAAWGAPAGHSDHAYCMATLANKRAVDRAAFSARMMAAGQAMQAAGGGYQVPVQSRPMSAPPIRTVCFSRGERTSGMNKICMYDCLGSAHAVTQSAVSLCPLTIQQ